MAIRQRPGYQTNVERTAKATEKKSVFLDLKPGEKKRLRFTPSSDENGELFFVSAQHFKLKDEGQPRAFACLAVHGEPDAEGNLPECVICTFLAKAETVFADNEALLDKLQRDHSVSYRWHAQVLPVPKDGQELNDQTYIMGFSKVTADKISQILKMEKDERMTLLTDPDEGQAITVSRNNATGFATRYEVMATGIRVSLDAISTKSPKGTPTWEEKFLTVKDALRLRIVSQDKMYKALAETVGVGVFSKVFPTVEL